MDNTCTKCGTVDVPFRSTYRRTGRPKDAKPTHKRISYGYRFNKYECKCGNTWEMKTHLLKEGDTILINKPLGWYPKDTKGIIEKLVWLLDEPCYQTTIPVGLVTDESIRKQL